MSTALSTDFSKRFTEWIEWVSQSAPTIYDKAVDSVYNETHVGGFACPAGVYSPTNENLDVLVEFEREVARVIAKLLKGDRLFDLRFFHANYPQGVNEKIYPLHTINRGEKYVLARTTDHSPPRFLCIHKLTDEWIRKHFHLDESQSIEEWLGRHAPSSYFD